MTQINKEWRSISDCQEKFLIAQVRAQQKIFLTILTYKTLSHPGGNFTFSPDAQRRVIRGPGCPRYLQ